MELLTSEIRNALPKRPKGSNPMVHVRLFMPTGGFTWYVTSFDGDDTLFGYVHNSDAPYLSEMGSFSLSELGAIVGPLHLGVERDVGFTPAPLNEALKAHGHSR